MEEEIGGGLAVADLDRAEDPPGEALIEPGELELEGQLVGLAAGGDAGRGGDAVERLLDAVDRLQLALEGLGVPRAAARDPVLGERMAQVRLDGLAHHRRRAPDVAVDDLLLGEVEPELGEHHRVDADGDRLAVDEHPVAVEDDQVAVAVRGAHAPEHTRARRGTPRSPGRPHHEAQADVELVELAEPAVAAVPVPGAQIMFQRPHHAVHRGLGCAGEP